MKLLLDESIPRKLAAHFPDHFEVTTVQVMGWGGTKNGELLKFAGQRDFAALITADRGIEYQQNTKELPCAVIILRAMRTRLDDLIPLVPSIVSILESELKQIVYHVEA